MYVKPARLNCASLGVGRLLTSIQHLSEPPEEGFPVIYSLEAHK